MFEAVVGVDDLVVLTVVDDRWEAIFDARYSCMASEVRCELS